VKDYPFVSIVVASYNRKYIIKETIQSLIDLNYPEESYEIVLIDNYSVDGTVEEVTNAFKSHIEREFLKVVPLSYNSGSSGSYVEALTFMNPDWNFMLKMDEDLILDENCLLALVQEAKKSDKNSVVGGKVFFYKERNRFHAIGSALSPWFAIAKGVGVNEIDTGQYEKTQSLDALNGCMILIARVVYEKVGWFDTDYFLYYDDHDLMYKSKLAGYNHVYTPKAIGFHDTSTGSKKKYSNKLWLYYSIRGSWLFLFKNFRFFSKDFFIYFFIHNLKFLVGIFYIVVNSNKANLVENLSISLTGYIHGLKKKTGHYDLDQTGLKIVLFSGGRGSGKISNGLRSLARSSNFKIEVIHITNAYDDGKSTGAVRRFFNNSILGPSDVRKIQENQFDFFFEDKGIKDFLTLRLDGDKDKILHELKAISNSKIPSTEDIYKYYRVLPIEFKKIIDGALRHFFSKDFYLLDLEDFALSNLIYASLADLHGGLQEAEEIIRQQLRIPDPVLLNSGQNSYAYALTESGVLLSDEASIVDYSDISPIYEVYLSDKPLDDKIRQSFLALGAFEEKKEFALKHSSDFPSLSPKAKSALEVADIVIFGPGTQYSSLYPSYFTKNLASVLRKIRAFKIIITNINHDNETPGFSSVDQIRQALFYLNQKGKYKYMDSDFFDVMIANEPKDEDTKYIRPNRTELEQLNIKNIVIQDIEDPFSQGSHDGNKVANLIINSFRSRWK
jgi:GT2 family glycosyltransferase/2-phospho-L-lactate transferase/gluconeogenesis factor (CofD/UPF0052 family)